MELWDLWSISDSNDFNFVRQQNALVCVRPAISVSSENKSVYNKFNCLLFGDRTDFSILMDDSTVGPRTHTHTHSQTH